MARTFALIAPVQLILHQVLGRNETIPNASKHCKMHQKGGLCSNGLDWVCSMWKITTRIHGTNFWINFNSSACFEPSIVKQRNGPKCTQTLRNKTKQEFRVQWGRINCSRCEKFGHNFVAWTFALAALVQPILHRVSCSNEMVPNAPKHYEK